MPIKKLRFNITLDLNEADVLTELAKTRRKSVAGFTKELILEALELHEDRALSVLADQRLLSAKKESKKTISHEKAWK